MPSYPLVDLEPQRTVLWANAEASECALEQYRIVRTTLLQHPRQPRMVVVSSPGPQDGKSTTAINLAGVLAIRSRVILLDCDLRRSCVGKTLGFERTSGMFSVLSGGEPAEAIVRASILPNLAILPAGAIIRNPAEMLHVPAWPSLVARLRAEFDYIVCDGPPINGLADYPLIENAADASLLVVRANHTDRTALGASLRSIDGDKFLGVVLNQSEDWFLWRSRSSYAYYEYSNPAQTETRH